MTEVPANPLISTTRTTDAGLQVQLHPLVLLTISDYITRHQLRQLPGPVVGAILGQHNGRELTMEAAFECKLQENANGDTVMHEEWFADRLESLKDVHKSPQLDFVGWFTVGDPSGPQPHHLPLHQRLQEAYNESAVLLLFHPSQATDDAALAGGKLPLTLYESVWEGGGGASSGGDKAMEIDGGAGARQQRFREMEFAVETGEAEMIGMDFVARGGGAATTVNESGAKPEIQEPEKKKAKGKGKAKEAGKAKEDSSAETDAAKAEAATEEEDAVLSPEDEELVTSLTAKANAIKMLQSRIHLLSAYLATLPPCYLTDASLPIAPSSSSADDDHPALNHPLLRSIAALVARLALLAPANAAAFARESLEQTADVALANLLAAVTESVHGAKELGGKHAVFEAGKGGKGPRGRPAGGGGGPGGGGGLGMGDGFGGPLGGGGASSDFFNTVMQGDARGAKGLSAFE